MGIWNRIVLIQKYNFKKENAALNTCGKVVIKIISPVKGMAHGIENLAVDYVTGNLYWTDSDYKWIMVSDMDCKHYTHVSKCGCSPQCIFRRKCLRGAIWGKGIRPRSIKG